MTPLRIDIVSDVVCPWCIIGYLQLQRALQALAGEVDVDLHWHPFELNPNMPAEGENLRDHVARKYGSSAADSGAARTRLIELGDELGFQFNYSDQTRMVNTFVAHQLLHWAGQQGRQTAVKLGLFEAFFTASQDVSDIDVLVRVAADCGLDPEQARLVLEDQRFAETVRSEQAFWLERDVHAVPATVLNRQFMIPGAQDPATFERYVRRLLARAASAEA